ncbi:MAG: aminopeptidase P family protein [Promethearchaeota archaeon]|nr:MAG: aminopeptidase P family protein [Candidatus Lokiarchaeota archaeon]
MKDSEFNHKVRLKKVYKLLDRTNLDYAIITNIQNLYWLSGTAQYGTLIISKDKWQALFIRRNFFKGKKESILENVKELKKTSELREYIIKQEGKIGELKIGMELDSLPASYYLYYKDLFKDAEIRNIELSLRKLRMIKDEQELEICRKSGKIAQKAQEKIVEILKPGIKEYEIAAEVVYEALKNKSVHFSNINNVFGKNFLILASGENLYTPSYFPVLSGNGLSKAIPYGYSDREIRKGDIVMCDYAINYKGYHADHARTFYVDKLPKRFKERYMILKYAYEEIKSEYLRAGVMTDTVFKEMKALLEKEGLGKFFQGNNYYYQGLGHGIGLELDEPPGILPNKGIELKENMVIALEPKIIIPDWGAIDLEDNFIIKKGKPEQITNTSYLFE